MKKYDFIILVTYLFLLSVGLIVIKNSLSPEGTSPKEALAHIKKLYRHPIRAVVIRNTALPLTVVKAQTNSEKGSFRFTGNINAQKVQDIRILNDTLFMEGIWDARNNLILHITPEIQVDTFSAPHVQIILPSHTR